MKNLSSCGAYLATPLPPTRHDQDSDEKAMRIEEAPPQTSPHPRLRSSFVEDPDEQVICIKAAPLQVSPAHHLQMSYRQDPDEQATRLKLGRVEAQSQASPFLPLLTSI